MKYHTARQIVSQKEGKTAISVAKASGMSLDKVFREAKKTLDQVRKRERRNGKNQ
jgi:hypothetical protein